MMYQEKKRCKILIWKLHYVEFNSHSYKQQEGTKYILNFWEKITLIKYILNKIRIYLPYYILQYTS